MEKTVFEEIGEYINKEVEIRDLLKDPENLSIVVRLLEEDGWEIH